MSFDLPPLPNDWKYLALNECAQKQSISYGIVQPGTHENSGIPVIRVNNFKDNRLDLSDVLRVTPEIESKYQRTRLSGGEVLLTLVGSVGQVTVAPIILAGFNVARAVAVIHPLPHIEAQWIALCLSSPLSQHILGSRANTTVQTTINLKDLRELPIPIAPKNERKNILDIMCALDNRISLLRETNTTLEAIAQTIFKSWFVDFDPVKAKAEGRLPEGMDEATTAQFPSEFEESALGLIPKGWRVGMLGNELKITYGKNLPTNKLLNYGFPVFGGNGQIGFFDKYIYEERQILISCRGAASGKVNQSLPKSFITNNSLVLETGKGKLMRFGYLKWLMKNSDLSVFVTGSAQPQVTIDNIKGFKMLLPDVPILDLYESISGDLEDRIEENEKQSQTLTTLRDTLLPRLISGQLRLNQAQEIMDEVGA